MSQAIRIGILGASSVAEYALIKPALTTPSAKVVAVAARDIRKAKQYATKHGIPKVHDTYEALINDPEIDAIYIGLPNSHHCEWTIKSLKAGKNVLCEKPLANNAEEAQKMSEAVKQSNGLIFMEAFHYKYHPMGNRIKEICEKELEGKIKNVIAQIKFPIISGNDIRYNYKLGGGALMDCGCYAINVLRYVFGEELEVVTANCELAYPNVDQTTVATFKTPSGKTGTIECSLYKFIPKLSLEVYGENGAQLYVTNWLAPHMLYNKIKLVRADGTTTTETAPKDVTSYGCQLKVFIEAIQTKDTSKIISTVDDGVLNMIAIDSVYKKAGLVVRGTPVEETKK